MAQYRFQSHEPPEDPRIYDMKEFWFHVFAVNDINDIRGIVLNDERMEEMKRLKIEMKFHYNHEESDEELITEGKYYALFDEEWHRVKCLNCDYFQGTATVLFIDRGDEDTFRFEDFIPLHPNLCRLPAQSVRLSIDGLALFQECVALHSLIDDLLLDNDVFVKVLKCKKDKNEAHHILAELTLNSGIIESETILVRDLLQDEIVRSIANPMMNIDNNELFQKVHISHISQNDIYVQTRFEGLVYLNKLIDQVSKEFSYTECYKHQPIAAVDESQVHLFKNGDGKWYRVRVTKVSNSQVTVRLIDVGSKLVIKCTQLVPLKDSSNLLSRYPEQAIRVKLHKIPPLLLDERMMIHFHQFLSNYEFLHMRTVERCDDEIPVVQFYQRDSGNNLVLINSALAVQTLLRQCPPESRNEFPLRVPQLPDQDSCFDVQVVLVAHPENLIVQPLSSRSLLQSLMIDLLDECKLFNEPHLTADSITVGQMCAAMNAEDGTWYRGFIYKKFNQTTFAVYACDYGDCFIASSKDLQPLQEQFYDLPFQAIKAKLVGIDQDILREWTVYDSLKLNEMIASKEFVAVVKDQEIDNRVFGQVKLTVFASIPSYFLQYKYIRGDVKRARS